jgi:16S rRNA (guanine527-N7)-methyltransferase
MIEAIKQDLVGLGLSGHSDQETAPALNAFLSLLQRWNGTYNLTAIRDPAQMRVQHLLDCLAVIPALRSRFNPGRHLRVLDVGSGGGLPGVVLAILHPLWSVDCIDAVAKKSAFIRQVAGQLGLKNLRALHGRVEELEPQAPYDLIISRAFSSLDNFITWTEPLLAPQGLWAAMKGKHPAEEIAALPKIAALKAVEAIQLPGTDSSRCLVILESKQ